jgi:hypothetical protein
MIITLTSALFCISEDFYHLEEHGTEGLQKLYSLLNIIRVITERWLEVLKGMDYFGDIEVNGRITLNTIRRRQNE